MSEHSFQTWTDRFLDRVVLAPMFTSGFDIAAWDMANVRRRAALSARGIKFGIPDVFVAQQRASWGRISAWLELKRGTDVSARQEATQAEMKRAGQMVSVCSTIPEVLRALRHFGFDLHQNADALAAEYEMRIGAKETAPRTPRKPAARKSRATAGQIKRAHAAGTWTP